MMTFDISVVMPVFNSEKYIGEAIDSVLSQTLRNFELIVIDDGSTDTTAAIVEDYSKQDHRIVFIRQEKKGLAFALNKGISVARGKYIARVDADDICLKDRFEQQKSFLDKNPDVSLCGSWMKTFGGETQSIWKYPLTSSQIKCWLLFQSPIAHPTVMFCREMFERHSLKYNETFPYAQDYELWARVADIYSIANIPSILVKYRLHSSQISTGKLEQQTKFAQKVRIRLLTELLNRDVFESEIDIHEAISFMRINPDEDSLRNACRWLRTLAKANMEKKNYSEKVFLSILQTQWYYLCRQSIRFLPQAPRLYRDAQFYPSLVEPLRQLHLLRLAFRRNRSRS